MRGIFFMALTAWLLLFADATPPMLSAGINADVHSMR